MWSFMNEILTKFMGNIGEWLGQSSLKLYVDNTVALFLSKSNTCRCFCCRRKIEVFEYLEVLLDPRMIFKSQIKTVLNLICSILGLFWTHLSLETAKMFMVLSNLTYCLTTWWQINTTALKPIESLYKLLNNYFLSLLPLCCFTQIKTVKPWKHKIVVFSFFGRQF